MLWLVVVVVPLRDSCSNMFSLKSASNDFVWHITLAGLTRGQRQVLEDTSTTRVACGISKRVTPSLKARVFAIVIDYCVLTTCYGWYGSCDLIAAS